MMSGNGAQGYSKKIRRGVEQRMYGAEEYNKGAATTECISRCSIAFALFFCSKDSTNTIQGVSNHGALECIRR